MSPQEISAFRQAALRAARQWANHYITPSYDVSAKHIQLGDVLDDTRRMLFFAPCMLSPKDGMLAWSFAQQPHWQSMRPVFEEDAEEIGWTEKTSYAWPNTEPRRVVMCATVLACRLANSSLLLVPRIERPTLPRIPQFAT